MSFSNEIITIFLYCLIAFFFEFVEIINVKRSITCRILLFFFGYFDYFFRFYLINFSKAYYKFFKCLFSIFYWAIIPKIVYIVLIYSVAFLPLWTFFLLSSIFQFLFIGIFIYSYEIYNNKFEFNSKVISYEIKIFFLIYSFQIQIHFIAFFVISIIEILNFFLFKRKIKTKSDKSNQEQDLNSSFSDSDSNCSFGKMEVKWPLYEDFAF